MKPDTHMKTNYSALIATIIISIFMALSLNSFSSSKLYLSAMFLYFLSGLATFIDKIIFYKYLGYKTEKHVSWICLCICSIIICLYIADSLNYIEIVFKCDDGIYKVLMQGVQKSFFTFNSINITPFIFIFAFTIPIFYLIIFIISCLRDKNITGEFIFATLKNNKLYFIIYLLFSIISGIVGIWICRLKYMHSSHEYGYPQYYKYFLLFFTLSISISYILLFCHYKKKSLKSNNNTEINPDSAEKP